MRNAWGWALVAALSAVSAPPSWAVPVAGVVVAVDGRPEVKAKGTDKFKRVKLNQFVYEGDNLKTGAGEKVAIAFIGGAEFKMNENSEFEVQSGGGAGQAASL